MVDSPYSGAHPQLSSAHADEAAGKEGDEQEQEEQEEQEVTTDGVGVGGALNDYGCGRDRASSQWLSQPEVQKALHVQETAGMQYNWGACVCCFYD